MRSPQEILNVARGKWPAVLRAEAAGKNAFPLMIPFGRPSTTADFATVRSALARLATANYEWDIEWEEINTRKWGTQSWPRRISFQSIEKLAHALELADQLASMREALAFARSVCPKLEPWLQSNAHCIPELLPKWKDFVRICAFFDENPTPNCFARQLPVSVGTKFIEEHAGILRDLLTVVLGDRINANGQCFEERFHLRIEPAQVRFRFLDPGLKEQVRWPVMECSIYANDLAGMRWSIPRVLIVENKAVFLCLPEVANTLAILGNGKATALLQPCRWLKDSDVVYWGDCDEAGFGILSSIRGWLPTVRSTMMDYKTWERWRQFAVPGKRDPTVQGSNLTAEEAMAFEAVIEGPWMLEQERIPAHDANLAVKRAFEANERKLAGHARGTRDMEHQSSGSA